MRCMDRNRIPLWYAVCTGEQEERDKYGHHTGRKYPTYGAPLLYALNISGDRGQAFLAENGIRTEYTRTLVTCDMALPFGVDTVLWIDREPFVTEDGAVKPVPHNYVVTNVSKTINSITITAREVSVQ